MDLASKSNLDPIGEDDIDKSSQPQENPAKYIPPARRKSLDSSGDDSIQTMSDSTSGSPQSATTRRTRSSNAIDSASSRTPSPRRGPLHIKDKSTGEFVEVWQSRRKGGNRVPKIEPEGTKTWRQPAIKTQLAPDSGDATVTNVEGIDGSDIQHLPIGAEKQKMLSLQFPRHQMPLRRWPLYPSILLNSIDMHLNILLQCISPGASEMSVRSISYEMCRVIEKKTFTPEMLPNIPFMMLPACLSSLDFVNLLSSVLTLLNIQIQHLAYLLFAEKAVQSIPARRDVVATEMLHSLAIAQINWNCCKDLVPNQVWSGFPIYDEHTPQVRALRETSLYKATEKVRQYIVEAVNKGGRSYDRDSRQLKRDVDDGLLLVADLPVWFSCLAHRWYGPVQSIPDYLALLRMAGFNRGKECPIQLPNPMEPRSVYEMTRQWLSRNGNSVCTTEAN